MRWTNRVLSLGLAAGFVVGMATIGCGSPKYNIHHAKTPDEELREQEKLGDKELKSKNDAPDSNDTSELDSEKNRKFDAKAATAELGVATRGAKTCPSSTGEDKPKVGTVIVTVVFANDGHPDTVKLSDDFKDTLVGGCVLKAFKAVVIKSFSDTATPIEVKVELEAPAAKADDKTKKGAKPAPGKPKGK